MMRRHTNARAPHPSQNRLAQERGWTRGASHALVQTRYQTLLAAMIRRRTNA